jgi:hypothetical protein
MQAHNRFRNTNWPPALVVYRLFLPLLCYQRPPNCCFAANDEMCPEKTVAAFSRVLI